MENETNTFRSQFPVLSNLTEKFDMYIPINEIEIYSRKEYNPPIFQNETDEIKEDKIQRLKKEFKKDFSTLILLFNAEKIRRMAHLDSKLFSQLILEKEYHAKNALKAFEKKSIIEWYDKRVLQEIDKYCMILNTVLDRIFSHFFTENAKQEINIKGLFDNWYDFFGTKEKPSKYINALDVVDPVFKDRFLDIEDKIISQQGGFVTAARCAAFCEVLYEKKIIENVNPKKRRMLLIGFALDRYKTKIDNALKTDSRKTMQRNNHKINKIRGLTCLNDFFK